MAPSTPTYYPYNCFHKPDVLDIALVNLPISVQVTNLNEISSDHNPVVLEMLEYLTPISASPSSSNTQINWFKFAEILKTSTIEVNPSMLNSSEIDTAIGILTTNVKSAIESSTHIQTGRKPTKPLPKEILDEIFAKTAYPANGKRTVTPQLKNVLTQKSISSDL